MYLALTIIFWAALALCAYVYAGFPLILRLWAGLTPNRPAPPADAPLPSVVLLISAYDEAKVIEAKLTNALSLDYPHEKLTVALVSDGSTDDTVAIARGFDDPRLKVFDFLERRGKNAALNDAIAQTSSDLLVFTDANSLYEPEALKHLARHFADPGVGLVVGQLKFLSDAGDPVDGGLYWRLETKLKEWEDAVGSVLVANGSIFAARRDLVGPLQDDVANDFQLPMEIGGMGKAIRFEPSAIAREKAASDQDEEFQRKVRIVMRGLTGAWRLRGHIRGKRCFLFASHKLLRWFAGFCQLALLITNALLAPTAPIYAAALVVQALFYCAAIGGFALRRDPNTPTLLRVPYYFCMVNAAAMVAVARILRGKRIRMWEKAETAR